MGHIGRIGNFEQRGAGLLPGFLYSFNIADLKRRNSHLGHQAGDADIAEFNRLLLATASPDVLVERTHGNKWLMLSRKEMTVSVHEILERYRKAEKFSAGWKIRAVLNGHQEVRKQTIPTEIRRGVRCLYAEAADEAALTAAIAQLAASDYNLPVDQPLKLADVPNLTRKPWQAVAEYPAEKPACPYCSSSDFEWEDGDDSVYSGDGKCRCGARVSISDASSLG